MSMQESRHPEQCLCRRKGGGGSSNFQWWKDTQEDRMATVYNIRISRYRMIMMQNDNKKWKSERKATPESATTVRPPAHPSRPSVLRFSRLLSGRARAQNQLSSPTTVRGQQSQSHYCIQWGGGGLMFFFSFDKSENYHQPTLLTTVTHRFLTFNMSRSVNMVM